MATFSTVGKIASVIPPQAIGNSMKQNPKPKVELKHPCTACGAELVYQPGTTNIVCQYCDHNVAIHLESNSFEELELYPYLYEMGGHHHSETLSILNCSRCGASQHIAGHSKSLHCAYCRNPLVVEDADEEEWLLPGAVLPFQFDYDQAIAVFEKWVKSLWFAPGKLKKSQIDPRYTKGLYVPYWTFDAQMKVSYSGRRGDYYYETRTVKDHQGNKRTERVRKTRWSSRSGRVEGFVNDTLVNASKNLTQRIPTKIVHWNLDKLLPYKNEFLSGFVTEKYTVPLKEGHAQNKQQLRNIAETWCRRDIGGDEQRVTSMDTSLSDETFKHILLPVYLGVFQFQGKEYDFYINGENGLIHGKRPYSAIKIALAVVAGLAVIGALVYFFELR